ncbi:MAG: shikimate kinase [Planctomycetes bacterium]|nr:shikimate kinase [Planctomycetota bacterium]
MSTIALIGYRGTGKSTLGEWLAEELGVPFVDTDEKVLEYLGMKSVTEVWSSIGEEGWRAAERAVIPPLLELDCVVALGGGAPMVDVIGKRLLTVPMVIHLWASSSVITERLSGADDRPVLSGGDLEVMYQRLPEYAMIATCGVETSGDLESTKKQLLHQATSPPNFN